MDRNEYDNMNSNTDSNYNMNGNADSNYNENYYNPNGYNDPNGYSNPNGYNDPNGYSNPNGYNDPNGYSNPNGYNDPNGYSNPNGYNDPNSYSNPNGYNDPNGYNNSYGYNNYGNQNYYDAQKPNKTLAIIALVVGIISFLTSCCMGGFLGIIGVIIAIVALVKKSDGKAMTWIGLVLSVLSVLVTAAILIFGIVLSDDPEMQKYLEEYRNTYEQNNDNDNSNDNSYDNDNSNDNSTDNDYYNDNSYGDDSNGENGTETGAMQLDHFWADKYRGSDNSTIYFYKDGTYDWYQDEQNSSNIKKGRYELKFGMDAFDYLVNDLSEYGLTADKLFKLISSDFSKINDLTVLDLWVDEIIIDGEEAENKRPYTHYYGFSNEEVFYGANMDAGISVTFTVEE